MGMDIIIIALYSFLRASLVFAAPAERLRSLHARAYSRVHRPARVE